MNSKGRYCFIVIGLLLFGSYLCACSNSTLSEDKNIDYVPEPVIHAKKNIESINRSNEYERCAEELFNDTLNRIRTAVMQEGFYYCAAVEGDDVFSLCDGSIQYAQLDFEHGRGYCVIVKDSIGNQWSYNHLQNYTVNEGDYVIAGDIIGHVGSTGVATGNNLVIVYLSSDKAREGLSLDLTNAKKALEETGYYRVKVFKDTEVVSICDGEIISVNWEGPYGQCIGVHTAEGIIFRYEHLDNVYVSTGDVIRNGMVLGVAGKTGIASDVFISIQKMPGDTPGQ